MREASNNYKNIYNISVNNRSDQEPLLPSMAEQQPAITLRERGPRREIWTHIFDWALVFGFVIAFTVIDKVNGHQREFSLTDQSLMYTFAVHEIIPTWLLVLCAVIAPSTIILIWTLVIPPIGPYQRQRWRKGEMTWKEKLLDANLSLLGIGVAIAATITITNGFKNLVGRPRPDFLDRCQPLPDAHNPSIFSLSNSSVCTQTALLKDGYRSFPSGHSSLSFAGLGFLSLFVAGRLNLMDTRGQVWKTMLLLIPLVAAAFIAVTRIMDNRHHPFDVIVGAILGMSLAWLSYRQYFPALFVAGGGRPYSLTELNEQRYDSLAAALNTTNAYPRERDLEAGQTRQTQGQGSLEAGRWGEQFSDDERPGIKLQDSQAEHATQDPIAGSAALTTMRNGGAEIH